jgi:hypothetical protein
LGGLPALGLGLAGLPRLLALLLLLWGPLAGLDGGVLGVVRHCQGLLGEKGLGDTVADAVSVAVAAQVFPGLDRDAKGPIFYWQHRGSVLLGRRP